MDASVLKITVPAALVEQYNALLAENEELRKKLSAYESQHCPMCGQQPYLYHCAACDISFYRRGDV